MSTGSTGVGHLRASGSRSAPAGGAHLPVQGSRTACPMLGTTWPIYGARLPLRAGNGRCCTAWAWSSTTTRRRCSRLLPSRRQRGIRTHVLQDQKRRSSRPSGPRRQPGTHGVSLAREWVNTCTFTRGWQLRLPHPSGCRVRNPRRPPDVPPLQGNTRMPVRTRPSPSTGWSQRGQACGCRARPKIAQPGAAECPR